MKCQSLAVENASIQESKADSRIHILMQTLVPWFRGCASHEAQQVVLGHTSDVRELHPQKEGGL